MKIIIEERMQEAISMDASEKNAKINGDQNKIKGIVFDLDGTIYTNEQFKDAYISCGITIISNFLKIPFEDARILIKEEKENLKKRLGYSPPFVRTILEFGIELERWINFVNSNLRPSDFINRDSHLVSLFNTLHKNFTIAILTNNNRIQTEEILKACGIRKDIDIILTISETKKIKPHKDLIKLMLQELKMQPKETVFIGDKHYNDLYFPEQIGCRTILLNSYEDIFTIPEIIRCFDTIL